jgi:hypothetical protein
MTKRVELGEKVIQILADYMEDFAYRIDTELNDQHPYNLVQEKKLSKKTIRTDNTNSHVVEFLAYDGEEFVENVLLKLRSRSATGAERGYFNSDSRMWIRFQFIVEIDNLNRKEKRVTRVAGLGYSSRLWRTAQFFRRKNLISLEWTAKWFLRMQIKSLIERYEANIGVIRVIKESIEFNK